MNKNTTNIVFPQAGERWDAGERGILLDLARHDLPDVFRLLHGYQKKG